MKEITLKELQTAIAAIDHKNHAADQYFYKLAEEVGELAKAIRKGRRLESCGGIKGTVEQNGVKMEKMLIFRIFSGRRR